MFEKNWREIVTEVQRILQCRLTTKNTLQFIQMCATSTILTSFTCLV